MPSGINNTIAERVINNKKPLNNYSAVFICFGTLAKFPCSVTNDDVVDLWPVTIFLEEALGGIINELTVEVVAYQIDGATAKAATHDA